MAYKGVAQSGSSTDHKDGGPKSPILVERRQLDTVKGEVVLTHDRLTIHHVICGGPIGFIPLPWL